MNDFTFDPKGKAAKVVQAEAEGHSLPSRDNLPSPQGKRKYRGPNPYDKVFRRPLGLTAEQKLEMSENAKLELKRRITLMTMKVGRVN